MTSDPVPPDRTGQGGASNEMTAQDLLGLRSVRLSLAISETVRDHRIRELPGRVRSALRSPPVPSENPPGEPSGANVADARPGLPPYGHLRIETIGNDAMFSSLASAPNDDHVDIRFVEGPGRVEGPIEPTPSGATVLIADNAADLDQPLGDAIVVTHDAEVAAIARDRVGADRVLVVEYSFDPRDTSPLGTVIPDREGWCTFTEGAEPREGTRAANAAFTVYSGARQPIASWPDVAKRHEGVIVSRLHHSSERAFAEHVLAMAASGVVVAHAHDPLVDRLLPDATIRLDELGGTPAVSGFDRRRTAARARRLAFHNHQRIHRFEQILARLDIPTRPNPRVSVLLPTRRQELVQSAVAAVAAQSYPDIELVLVAHGFDAAVASKALAEANIEGKVVEVPASRSFGEALNRGLAVATGSLIAKMDDDDIYGPGHVEDLVVMFEAVGADIIGRAPDFVYLAQRDETLEVETGLAMTETWHVAGPTMMLERSIATSLLFEHRRHAVDQTLYDRAAAAGLRIVALDGFDFVLFRGHGDHTWVTADQNFVDAAVTRWNGLERSATMIGTERGHPASAD